MITNEFKQLNDNFSTPFLLPRFRGVVTLAGVVLLCIALAIGGERVTELLRYERSALVAGQLWRLVTGHIVHGSAQHALVNLLGLVMMWALFHRTFSIRSWLVIVTCSAVTIDAGFWFLMPSLQWYVGLSGVLHAVLAAGCIAWWKTEPKPLAILLTLILIGKLVWEQTQGALPLSGELPVVVNAHFYGEIGGLLGVWICRKNLRNLAPAR